jgi:hypothetical protein
LKLPDCKLAAACSLTTSAALADSVSLVDGDRLSGTLVHMEGDALWLDTPYAIN